jgi:hypothetical protein
MKVILSVPDEGYFERTWWRLFQKHIERTTFDIYVFIRCSERVSSSCNTCSTRQRVWFNTLPTNLLNGTVLTLRLNSL